jgi:hypothetical protein
MTHHNTTNARLASIERLKRHRDILCASFPPKKRKKYRAMLTKAIKLKEVQ